MSARRDAGREGRYERYERLKGSVQRLKGRCLTERAGGDLGCHERLIT